MNGYSLLVRTRHQQEIAVEFSEAAGLIVEADYVHWYDSLSRGNPGGIEVQDLALPAFLGAVPNFSVLLDQCGWKTLEEMLEKASRRLRDVPDGVDLVAWEDTDANRRLLKSLFQACTGGRNPGFPGFGPARCTKLLHKKRPALLPVIDSWQLEAWGKRADPWSTDDMIDVVFLIKEQLSQSGDALAEVRLELQRRDGSLPRLSDVRIYDVVFWERSRMGLELPSD